MHATHENIYEYMKYVTCVNVCIIMYLLYILVRAYLVQQ